VPGAIFALVPGVPLLRVDALGAAGLGLPRRDANAYKQALGHVLVVGGDYSMGGAVAMAAEAALRVGAGLVSVLTRAAHRPAILARRPELMVVDADDAAARQSVFGKASTLVVGPGLGRDPWGHALLREALDLGLPTLLDADGLNGLARLDLRPTQALVITPHAGEAAHLLGVTPGEIQQDRLGSALRLADRVNGVAVLKGAGTIVASAGEVLGVCGHGNPGMASAGMGDVLSGIIGGLIAQLPTPAAAAIVGTCLHSAAADLAAQQLGQPSLLATDLLPHLIELLRQAPERG
jgi:NAD(P)H-hydrate epimerase